MAIVDFERKEWGVKVLIEVDLNKLMDKLVNHLQEMAAPAKPRKEVS
jgi:hypothetical protein